MNSISFFIWLRRPPSSTLFPYTTLFRSAQVDAVAFVFAEIHPPGERKVEAKVAGAGNGVARSVAEASRGREHEGCGVEEVQRRPLVARQRGVAHLVGARRKGRTYSAVVPHPAEHAGGKGRTGLHDSIAAERPVAECRGLPAFARPALALAEGQLIDVVGAKLVADVERR